MQAIYVKDKAGNKFIATTQMVRRIESGELVQCEPPTPDEINAARRVQLRQREATAQMIAKMPEATPIRGEGVPAPELSKLANQIAAYEAAGNNVAAIQTNEEADQELAEIRAKTAALQAAVASGQVQLVDPSTVQPGVLTGVLTGAVQSPLAAIPQVNLDVPVPAADGNFQTAFQPAHPQTSVWGGLPQG